MFQVDEKGAVRNVQELEEKCIYNITICATDGVKFDRCTVTLRVNLPDEPTAVERTGELAFLPNTFISGLRIWLVHLSLREKCISFYFFFYQNTVW